MKSLFTSLLVFCTIAINAQFSGYYAPANWTTSHSSGCDDGYVNASGAPASIVIVGSEVIGCGSSIVAYGIAVAVDGTVSFNWNYTTTDCDGPSFDRFGYYLNGNPVQLSNNFGSNSQSGSVSIPVVAGDNVAFYVWSTDNFCGRAWSTISNFSGPYCDLVVNVDEASVIYNGYEPFSCTTLNATATTSYGPATITGTEVCATGPDCIEATVTATDAAGCEATATIIVPVVDVVCYGDDGELKVQLCHNGRSICVAPSAVAAHLAHGDVLGDCGEAPDCGSEGLQTNQESTEVAATNHGAAIQNRNSMFAPSLAQMQALSADQTNALSIEVNPNPATDIATVTVNRGIEGQVTISVFNLNGQVVLSSDAEVIRGVPVQLNVSKLIEGTYTIRMESRDGMSLTDKLTISNK